MTQVGGYGSPTPHVSGNQSARYPEQVDPGIASSGSSGTTRLGPTLATGDNYRRFAAHEPAGRSPDYEQLAYAVAKDEAIMAFLDGLPPGQAPAEPSLCRRSVPFRPPTGPK